MRQCPQGTSHSPTAWHVVSPREAEAEFCQEGVRNSQYCPQAGLTPGQGSSSKAEWSTLWAWGRSPAPPLTNWVGQVPWLLCTSVPSSVKWDKNSAYLIKLLGQFNELTAESSEQCLAHCAHRIRTALGSLVACTQYFV